MFISPRTVEYRLRKVFTKLSIRSRNELRAALPVRAREALRLSQTAGLPMDRRAAA